MAGFRDPSIDALEARTRAAHRAYIEALRHLEFIEREATCARRGCGDISEDEYQRRYSAAAAEKERRRIAFSDLCDQLGYVVLAPGVGLGPEDASDCRCFRDESACDRRDGDDVTYAAGRAARIKPQ